MTDTHAELNGNPLLVTAGLPPFDRIESQHVVPAVRHVLAEAAERVEELERNVAPSWAAAIEPLDEIGRRFEYAWSPVRHLFGVKNSPALREAYQSVLDEVVAFGLRVKQSEPIYRALKAIREGDEWQRLDDAQRRIVAEKLLDCELAGVGLQGPRRERFNEIARELSRLSTDFSNHVLDATKAWSLVLTERSDVEGLPASLLQLAAQSYNQSRVESRESSAERSTAESQLATSSATPETGPWRITLEAPICVPFLQHSPRRDLRETVYRAFITRASEGEFDNTPLIPRILGLRQEQAKLLGFDTYAEMSLARKMAPSVEAIEEMFETLRFASWGPAVKDMDDLKELAAGSGVAEPIAHWDVAFWAERLREQRFGFTDEELRPYFPLERVLEGMFSLAERLFGIRVVRADGEAPVWHKDVRFFKIFEGNVEDSLRESGRDSRSESFTSKDNHIASFYLDPYSRPQDKRGGAWMDDCLVRRRTREGLQFPVAHLVCNSTPPVGDRPSLMTFREVETLFHEFGHGLQHMLTRVDYADAAGINGIEWDAVELPSQFMENWCYHRPTLLGMTAHYETGEPLPEDLFEKICAARTFRAGSQMLRQLQFGMADVELHHRYAPEGDESVFDVQRRITEQTSVLPMLPEDRTLCSFQHIFSGGYAAGYYSYKWAEVLSADAFSAFEEAGLDDERAVAETGRRFRETILSLGGGRHPMEVFKSFRGREPDPEALLRHSGLV